MFWQTAVVTVLITPYLALSATLAPEHVHESDSDHHQSVAHRHFESHRLGARTHDGAAFDDDDDHVVWLRNIATHPQVYQVRLPFTVSIVSFDPVEARTTWIATSLDDAAPPHGPPRATLSLRAPPLSPQLI